MTEAMSRREIEDVLSSIRRIVSHDVHPNTQQGASHEKLLLTSALRVDDAAPDPLRVDSAPMEEQSPSARPSGPDEAERDPEAFPVLVQEDFSPEVTPSSLLARISSASKSSSFGLNAAPEQVSGPPSETLSSRVMEDEALTSIEDSALEATLARLEAVLAKTEQPDSADSHALETAGSDEEIIDEGVLYQIVAHIVRQELQGELGEKITRNIRKLVRSEVARELQLRKF